MKKIIILLLLVLISCGKESSVSHNNSRRYHPNNIGPGSDLKYQHTWLRFKAKRSIFFLEGYKNWGMSPTFKDLSSFKTMTFYYAKHLAPVCNVLGEGHIFNLSICLSNSWTESRTNYYSVYTPSPYNYTHSIWQDLDAIANIQRIFNLVTINNFEETVFYDPNSNTWIIKDGHNEYGFNNNYPIWANPVYVKEGAGTYWLSYIWIDL